MTEAGRFPKPPIVFLDIDGVANTCRAEVALGRPDDPVAYGLVKRLCRERFCEIVVSSSWRTDPRLLPLLAAHNLIGDLATDWRTRDFGSRSLEIADWLERDGGGRRYWILDDEIFDFTPDQLERLIQTDTHNGLGMREWQRLDDALRLHDHPGRLAAAMSHQPYVPIRTTPDQPPEEGHVTWMPEA